MPRARYLAVEFGGTHVACAAVQGDAVLEAVTLPIEPNALLRDVLRTIADAFRSFLSGGAGEFRGVGMGFCGLVDHRAGSIRRRMESTTMEQKSTCLVGRSRCSGCRFASRTTSGLRCWVSNMQEPRAGAGTSR